MVQKSLKIPLRKMDPKQLDFGFCASYFENSVGEFQFQFLGGNSGNGKRTNRNSLKRNITNGCTYVSQFSKLWIKQNITRSKVFRWFHETCMMRLMLKNLKINYYCGEFVYNSDWTNNRPLKLGKICAN